MRLYRSSRQLWALAALLLLPGAVVWAQGGGSAAAAAPAKIAVINIRQAIVATAEGKMASAQLQSQFAPGQAELDSMQKQITDLQTRLNNGARTLSTDQQTRLQRQGDLLTREFQSKQEFLQEEVTAAQGDLVDTIERKMLDVIDRYARDNAFAVVLDSSAQGSPVLYGSTQLDITDTIVRLYDQANPVKADAPAETKKPAAPSATPPGQAAAPKKPAQ
jgi:outer membrane protein